MSWPVPCVPSSPRPQPTIHRQARTPRAHHVRACSHTHAVPPLPHHLLHLASVTFSPPPPARTLTRSPSARPAFPLLPTQARGTRSKSPPRRAAAAPGPCGAPTTTTSRTSRHRASSPDHVSPAWERSWEVWRHLVEGLGPGRGVWWALRQPALHAGPWMGSGWAARWGQGHRWL